MKGGNIPIVELAFLAELSTVDDASGVAGVTGDVSSSVVRCASLLAGTLSLVSLGEGDDAVSFKAKISRWSRTDQISCGVVIVVYTDCLFLWLLVFNFLISFLGMSIMLMVLRFVFIRFVALIL